MGFKFAFVLCCILLVSCPSTTFSKTSGMARALLVEKKPDTSFHKNNGDGSGTVDTYHKRLPRYLQAYPAPGYPTYPVPDGPHN